MANIVRTIRHGVLKIKDSAAASITVPLMAGGLTCQLKNQPSQVIRDRGTLDQWMLLDQEPLEFSFEAQFTEIQGGSTAGFANLTPWEALGVANNNTVTLSSTSDSPAGEPTTFNLELTLTNPAGSGPATEVVTFNECIADVITLEEGYPGKISVTGAKSLSVVLTQT